MYEMTDLLKAEPNMDSDDSRDGGRYDQGTTSPLVKHPDTEPKLTTFTKALVTFAAIGGFLFGYDTGVVSGAMILIKDEFNLTTVWEEVVVSVTIGAAAVSALAGGTLNDVTGRRPMIILASILFMAGAIIMCFSPSKEVLVIGRLVVGLGVGLASMTVPMYIAEASPTHLRGRLVTVNQVFITGGQVIASVIDGALSYWPWGWRLMLGLGAVPAAIQLVGFIFLPESPRWLILHHHHEKARRVLTLVYGKGSPYIDSEYENISRSAAQQDKGKQWVILRILRTPAVLRAVIVGCGLQMFQQLVGINTVMYYSATIIRMSGVQDNSTVIWLAAVVAFCNFLFSLVGLYLVEKVGRRILTLGSLLGVAFSLSFLGVGFLLMSINSPVVTQTYPQAGVCNAYHDCQQCILEDQCGFCFELDQNKVVNNSSCLPVNNTNLNYATVGPCSVREKGPKAPEWAMEYCPTSFGPMAMVGLVIYLISFSPGMGPMPWTVNSEIYPHWARSTGNSLSAMTNWLFNLLISMTFLTLTEQITRQGTFFMYSGIAVVGLVLIYWLLPETKGRPLEEVIDVFKKPWCCAGQYSTDSPYSPLGGATHSSNDQAETELERYQAQGSKEANSK
ncbi:proton myo-inositol cotransporter-like isoform X1 [Asterias rubens]|uniref:proton myo-inositol cotransporter-like isoform X1 n=1 Tax=Asterias rubens TaxID=7604 RepID=UPI00145509E8|nr:proton myo-inositol cotransporter-like isoform X1 [Asterias rubens]